ncbi:MAG: aminotransferase class V-fold PLP-dependent enzyme [Pseudomonadota bacterium]
MDRVYLDWNATAPLRPEARAAMLAAMDTMGNPSSVHAEGRAARALVENARGHVAKLVSCDPEEVVFTSGATEANVAILESDLFSDHIASPFVHDSVYATLAEWRSLEPHDPRAARRVFLLDAAHSGTVYDFGDAARRRGSIEEQVFVEPASTGTGSDTHQLVLTHGDGETGLLFDAPALSARLGSAEPRCVNIDVCQTAGRVPLHGLRTAREALTLSAHKLGGPAGTGALISDALVYPLIRGGGQEKGRRSGTENVVGIAGFGAAAQAALRDLESGGWERIAKLRNILEEALASASNETIFIGRDQLRLANTSCFATPGWNGGTQVMQMDLAGYAISAGSACSSGKVKQSRVLRAMGYDSATASSAVRVSLGPTTTEAQVLGFAKTWAGAYRRWKQRAA